MTKEELAAVITGREYGREITKAEEQRAKESGLVVIMGQSDDIVEFHGAVYDDISAYGGTKFLFDPEGPLPEFESAKDRMNENQLGRWFQRKAHARLIEAIWRNEEPPWTFKTDIPHATFEIVEDGRLFCRAIIVDLKDFGAAITTPAPPTTINTDGRVGTQDQVTTEQETSKL